MKLNFFAAQPGLECFEFVLIKNLSLSLLVAEVQRYVQVGLFVIFPGRSDSPLLKLVHMEGPNCEPSESDIISKTYSIHECWWGLGHGGESGVEVPKEMTL